MLNLTLLVQKYIIIYMRNVKESICMQLSLNKLVDNNFPPKLMYTFYYNITTAITACNQFINNNEDFFNIGKRNPLYGYLMSYAVEKQFTNQAFTPEAPYNLTSKRVNKYNHNAFFIITPDFYTNVFRTQKNKILPNNANYKKELARNNTSYENQLQFDFMNPTEIIDEPKYALITYGHLYGDITHINLLIPNKDFNGILCKKNILSNYRTYDGYISEEEQNEDIIKLNEDLKIKLKGDSNG